PRQTRVAALRQACKSQCEKHQSRASHGRSSTRGHGRLLSQRVNQERISRTYGYVLAAIYRVSDGRRLDRAADHGPPEQRSRAGIQGEEIAVSSAAEQHVGSRGENPGFGDLRHFEIPL